MNSGIGLENGMNWITGQIGFGLLIVAAGLTVMFFLQKQTVKAITTIIAGSLLYIIVRDPEGTFTAIGTMIKGLLGI